MNESVAVGEHCGNSAGGDQVADEHGGIREEGAVMTVSRGNREQQVEQHLEGQDEAENPCRGALPLGDQRAQGPGHGQQKNEQAGLRQTAVSGGVTKGGDQDRRSAQGSASHGASAAGKARGADHGESLSTSHMGKATRTQVAFPMNSDG